MSSKDSFFSRKHTMNLGGTLTDLNAPMVMGILNITPDSFFDGGKYLNEQAILKRCKQIVEEGAAIIDIGAYSSRPGAADVSPNEEIDRLSRALSAIRKELPNSILSVDTFRSNVAKHVVNEFGVHMINDISAGNMDTEMLPTIAELRVPYIMMHMVGTPQNMQMNTTYKQLINDIITYFANKIEITNKLGIKDVIIDPGFGFSKTLDQNFELLKNLGQLEILEKPILVGLSRKSMIYKTINSTPENALGGTIAAHSIALLNGANILRVHDVKDAIETINIINKHNNVRMY